MKFTNSVAALAAALITAHASAQTSVAPIDGGGNNVANPAWGSAGTRLLRFAPPAYADGIFSPAFPGNLSPRLISNMLNDQTGTNNEDIATIDQNSLSDFGYAYGQFIDHDMDLTPDTGASFPILVAANDPIGPQPLPFNRSLIDPTTGVTTPAEQVNVVTAFLDLSQVYGSSQDVSDALRTFQGGLLKTGPGNMLPYLNGTYFTPEQIAVLNMANDAHAVVDSELFAAGDRRANENLELTVLETLFVRNHNRLARVLVATHNDWTDEQLFQTARKLNIAQYQRTIYNEWLPSVFGPNALSRYTGYHPEVNPGIATEFSTVAFRFGHSMLSADIERKGDDGMAVAPEVSLAVDFFNPHLLNPNGVLDPLTGLTSTDIGPVLRAEASGNGQAMDLLAVGDVRNLLFGNGGQGGDDLMARDVQRARDHGIPDYNTVRTAIGLPIVANFAGVIAQGTLRSGQRLSGAEATAQQQLALAYPGGVNTIDVFEGGLAERHVSGSDVGPTFQTIMVDQFERLRDGDRFFYRNLTFTAEETNLFAQANTLAEIIMANTEITNLQNNVMVFRASISGNVAFQSTARTGGQISPASGVTVQLRNEEGNITATTRTDQGGHFSFNQRSGPAAASSTAPGVSGTGIYSVSIVAPRGAKQSSANPGGILISRGDTSANSVNFTLASTQTAWSGPRRR
jgi:hypothetical protein